MSPALSRWSRRSCTASVRSRASSTTLLWLTSRPSSTYTPPAPSTVKARPPSHTIAVSSSMPTPSMRGFCATAPMSRPMRPRSAKCWSTITPGSRPNPGAMRSASSTWGDAELFPVTIIVSVTTDAPADVPATQPPLS